ncbi:unnamed protein product [Victoria cruziana]
MQRRTTSSRFRQENCIQVYIEDISRLLQVGAKEKGSWMID